MFSRSYATSHDIEQQRLSSPSTSLLSPPAQLARAMRSIPDELRAIAPSSPYTVIDQPLLEEDEDETAGDMPVEVEEEQLVEADQASVAGPAQSALVGQEEDATLVDAPVEPEEPAAPLPAAQRDDRRARPSFIGRLLFPPSAPPLLDG